MRHAPLTDLMEVEGLLDAVSAKLSGWLALLEICDARPELSRAEVEQLRDEALDQRLRLGELHRIITAQVLTA